MCPRPVIGISARAEPPSGSLSLPTYSIYQPYVHSVGDAGGLPVLLPPTFGENEALDLLARLDGLILSGGGDIGAEWYGAEDVSLLRLVDKARDQAEIGLLRAALRSDRPVLAICRGIQVLNVATGGTLYPDIATCLPQALPHRPPEGKPREASAHAVQLTPTSRLASIFGRERLTVNSFHHQAARRIGEGLVVTARAPDGVVEGLEHPGHPFCIGVQWHPEMGFGCQEGMDRLFQALVQATQR